MEVILEVLAILSLFSLHVGAQVATPSHPTQPNISKNCNAWHTVVGGVDGCWSIEQQYSISHENFILWNPDVSNDCITNFWPDYSYCIGVGPTGATHPNIAKNCKAWHTVVGGEDGCWSIEQKYSITHDNFILWNPDVSADCVTNFWPDYSYCVVASGPVSSTTSKSSTAPVTTTRSSTRITTSSLTTPTANATYSIREPIVSWNVTTTSVISSVFPPQHTQPGQPPYCNNWHLVEIGNTCQNIVGANSWLSIDDFLDWNPTLGDDCSGLYAGWWVCIGAQPQTVTASFEYITSAPVVSVPEPTPYVSTTLPAINSTFTALPAQAGMPENCKSYYQAQTDDTCQAVLQYKVITEAQFFAWNPALAGNCQGMWVGYWYCVAAFESGKLPLPPTETIRPIGAPLDQIGTCNKWYERSDGENCDEIVEMFGTFSKANFVAWNPSVGSSCSNLEDMVFYCAGIPGTPTTRTAPVPTTNIPTETPVQPGMVSGCSKLWLVSSSDDCDSIATSNGITEAQLLIWNPSVGTTTCTNLDPNFYICVGLSGASVTQSTTAPPTSTIASSTSRTASTTTTLAGGTVSTPTPHQAGMVSGCRRFYKTQLDDGCWAIANSAGIQLSDFYAWNPAVGACEGLWFDTWYCIGLAGSVTSISSGPPVPT